VWKLINILNQPYFSGAQILDTRLPQPLNSVGSCLCWWVPSTQLAVHHISGAYNFEAAPRYFENLWSNALCLQQTTSS